MNRLRKTGAVLAAVIVPVAGACSGNDKVVAPDIDDTTTTTTQIVGPQTTGDPPLNGNIPTILLCGHHPGEEIFEMDVDSISPHIAVINPDGGRSSLTHKRLPSEVIFAEGSTDEFKQVIEGSLTSIGSVLLPQGIEGVASFTYPGLSPEETFSYTVSLTPDGTAALGIVESGEIYAVRGEVSAQSVIIEDEVLVDVGLSGISSESTATQFLNPGATEWVEEVRQDVMGTDNTQVSEFISHGNAASLSAPLTDSKTSAAAMVLDRELASACVVQAGPVVGMSRN